MNKKFFLIISINVIIIISIIGVIYFVNYFSHKGNTNEKAEEEIKYISNEIIDLANLLNNITFNNSVLEIKKENKEEDKKEEKEKEEENLEEKIKVKYNVTEQGILNTNLDDINWEYIKDKTERLYSIWTIAIIDLRTLNVNSEDILDFSNTLDLVNLSSKNEDKNSLINNLINLYVYIPNFYEQISEDNSKIEIEKTKLSILNSYAFVNSNNWIDARLNLQNGISNYSNIINNIDEKSNNNKISKIYIHLNELQNTLELQDKDLYFIKYKSLMEELINFN